VYANDTSEEDPGRFNCSLDLFSLVLVVHFSTHLYFSALQRTRSTGGQVVDLKNAEEETRTSYDQKADRLLARLADQDRTIASLNKQIGRALARVEEVEQEADRRAAVVEASAEQHLGNLTAGAHAQTVQRFEHVQKALQQCAARCDRVEAEMHAQVAPRVTACVQAVDALDARLRATQQAAATEAAARAEFETAYRSFLEQFQGEVAQAISSMHKKAKVCVKGGRMVSLDCVCRVHLARVPWQYVSSISFICPHH
jgi:chromosome segregation ATPase